MKAAHPGPSVLGSVLRALRRADTPMTKRAKRLVQAVERAEIPAPRALFGPSASV